MDLLKLLQNMKGKRVLVVGDLILDCFVWGKVRRISPEAPVPIVEVTRDTFVLGGAANVAHNIVALGGCATVIGVTGSDRMAALMQDILADVGIASLSVQDKRPTTVKTRVIAHSQQVVRIDQESTEKITGKTLKTLIACIGDAAKTHDAIVVSDYRKGVITPDVMRAITANAGGRRKRTLAIDPKPGHFHLYKSASLLTPNLAEASQGAGIEITDEESLIAAGRKLLSKLGAAAVLITRGEDGMSLFERGKLTHIPTAARKVYDVTGAGDTVVATMALARAAGSDMLQAAVLANHAAGIVVGEVGTATASAGAIRQSLKNFKPVIDERPLKGF